MLMVLFSVDFVGDVCWLVVVVYFEENLDDVLSVLKEVMDKDYWFYVEMIVG